jgi:hypothetical protein
MSAVYRVRQFIRAAGATVRSAPEEEGIAARHLTGEGLALFRAMPSYDRRHALDVVATLQGDGHTDRDLLAAALLHDVGKTVGRADAETAKRHRGLRLWHRVAVVLIRAVQPRLLDEVARDEPGSWRQSFYIQQNHAAISAELAEGADCSPQTVTLIRHHEDPVSQVRDPLLMALQAADAAN